jgi:hypothetical protein
VLKHLPCIEADAPTPLWRALDEPLDTLADQGEERRVILVLSDGKDSGPIGFRQRFVSQAEIIDRARNDAVMVYAIGMRSRGTPPMPGIGPASRRCCWPTCPTPGSRASRSRPAAGTRRFGSGRTSAPPSLKVADELHRQYLVGFDPPKRDGKVHDIEVRVTQRGLKPRGRKSYVAPKE